MKTIAIASVIMSCNNGTTTTTNHTLCWVPDVTSEDEIRGIAVKQALEAKPDFVINDVLVKIIEIPEP